MKGRLEREIEELMQRGIHSTSLTPVLSRVALPRDPDFFDQREAMNRLKKQQWDLADRIPQGAAPIYYASNVTLSTFYELLSAALYGGIMFNSRYVLDREGQVLLREGRPFLNGLSEYEKHIKFTKPDLVNEKNLWIGEVKAFRSGRSYKFRDDQMARYLDLQASMPRGTTIDFVIYRHTVRDFSHTPVHQNQAYTDEELFRALAQRTAHSIVLPLNLVQVLHSTTGASPYVFRDEGKIKNPRTELGAATQYGNPGTCIRSPGANKLLFEPEEVLKDLGLNLKEYEIERMQSPQRLRVGPYRVSPFPITRIRYKHKHYALWVDTLRQQQPDTLSDIPDDDAPSKSAAKVHADSNEPF